MLDVQPTAPFDTPAPPPCQPSGSAGAIALPESLSEWLAPCRTAIEARLEALASAIRGAYREAEGADARALVAGAAMADALARSLRTRWEVEDEVVFPFVQKGWAAALPDLTGALSEGEDEIRRMVAGLSSLTRRFGAGQDGFAPIRVEATRLADDVRALLDEEAAILGAGRR